MREILFKAKRIDNGEWIEGYYLAIESKSYIICAAETMCMDGENADLYATEWYEIDPTTICDPTGLTDKNGNMIWENDIVFVTDDEGNSGQVDTGVGEIDFLEGLWYISGSVQNSLYDINKCFQIEVIGNIFDNSELIKECD